MPKKTKKSGHPTLLDIAKLQLANDRIVEILMRPNTVLKGMPWRRRLRKNPASSAMLLGPLAIRVSGPQGAGKDTMAAFLKKAVAKKFPDAKVEFRTAQTRRKK